jgi:VCBS repeat-containing protein
MDLPLQTESQIFDANRRTPVDLLQELYERHQVLVLAEQSHQHATAYALLRELLTRVGHDPRLKYIVLERFHDDASLLQEASVHTLTEAELQTRFSSDRARDFSLCTSGEWAFTWAEFLESVNHVNRGRPKEHPVLVTSVDGASNQLNPFGQTAVFLYLTSINREVATRENFERTVWSTLSPTDKVIVIYNYAHVIKGFRADSYRLVDDTLPNKMQADLDWMSMFVRKHPEAESRLAIVLLDEKDSTANPDGVLRFTQRQVARSPGAAFGVALAPFRRVLTEQGSAVFVPGSWLLGYKPLTSTALLPDMLDAVIWTPDAEAQWKLEPASAYLPTACGR